MLDTLKDQGVELSFPVVSDASKAITKAYGVYDSDHEIALPAVLILDRELKVAWSHLGESIFDRPPEEDVVENLKRLRGS